MAEKIEDIAIALFSELLIADQLARSLLTKALPKGMELSQFSVLNHLAGVGEERTPAQLAKSFHVTRGAMTNTLGKLEWAGHVHIRPDWDDARRKFVAISPAGRAARDAGAAAGALSCVRSSKSLASWRSRSWPAGSPLVRFTMRPRTTAGRARIVSAQRRRCR